MQFFTHETLTGSVALKTTRELRLNDERDEADFREGEVVFFLEKRQRSRNDRLQHVVEKVRGAHKKQNASGHS